MTTQGLHGLYAIIDHVGKTHEQFVADAEAALLGGATIVQYRNRHAGVEDRQKNAAALATLCRERGAMFIVNDDVELAQQTNANGVHLGINDMGLEAARAYLGSGKIIGVSCYANIARASHAQQLGADYVAFGRFFPSLSKPDATPASIEVLREARKHIQLPIAAIGGITAENGMLLIHAGADMLAVIHGIFGQEDILLAARRITALFYPPAL